MPRKHSTARAGRPQNQLITGPMRDPLHERTRMDSHINELELQYSQIRAAIARNASADPSLSPSATDTEKELFSFMVAHAKAHIHAPIDTLFYANGNAEVYQSDPTSPRVVIGMTRTILAARPPHFLFAAANVNPPLDAQPAIAVSSVTDHSAHDDDQPADSGQPAGAGQGNGFQPTTEEWITLAAAVAEALEAPTPSESTITSWDDNSTTSNPPIEEQQEVPVAALSTSTTTSSNDNSTTSNPSIEEHQNAPVASPSASNTTSTAACPPIEEQPEVSVVAPSVGNTTSPKFQPFVNSTAVSPPIEKQQEVPAATPSASRIAKPMPQPYTITQTATIKPRSREPIVVASSSAAPMTSEPQHVESMATQAPKRKYQRLILRGPALSTQGPPNNERPSEVVASKLNRGLKERNIVESAPVAPSNERPSKIVILKLSRGLAELDGRTDSKGNPPEMANEEETSTSQPRKSDRVQVQKLRQQPKRKASEIGSEQAAVTKKTRTAKRVAMQPAPQYQQDNASTASGEKGPAIEEFSAAKSAQPQASTQPTKQNSKASKGKKRKAAKETPAVPESAPKKRRLATRAARPTKAMVIPNSDSEDNDDIDDSESTGTVPAATTTTTAGPSTTTTAGPSTTTTPVIRNKNDKSTIFGTNGFRLEGGQPVFLFDGSDQSAKLRWTYFVTDPKDSTKEIQKVAVYKPRGSEIGKDGINWKDPAHIDLLNRWVNQILKRHGCALLRESMLGRRWLPEEIDFLRSLAEDAKATADRDGTTLPTNGKLFEVFNDRFAGKTVEVINKKGVKEMVGPRPMRTYEALNSEVNRTGAFACFERQGKKGGGRPKKLVPGMDNQKGKARATAESEDEDRDDGEEDEMEQDEVEDADVVTAGPSTAATKKGKATNVKPAKGKAAKGKTATKSKAAAKSKTVTKGKGVATGKVMKTTKTAKKTSATQSKMKLSASKK